MNVSQRRKRRSLQSFDVTVLGQNNLTWVIEELEKFTKYCIEIVGFNRKGDGKQSNWVCTMTDEDGKIEPFLTLTTDSGTHCKKRNYFERTTFSQITPFTMGSKFL